MKFIGKTAVAQSGGPTSAINATLCGVIEAAMENGVQIYGARHGIKGIINCDLVFLNPMFSTEESLNLLKYTPASFLGSCRYKLPELSDKNDIYEEIFDNLEKNGIENFIYIGGNDSMDTVFKLSEYAKAHNKPQKFVGVPKTVDNDLAGTDHSPGFGSCAKYIASTIKCIARDSAVYAEKSVTIVELMGRNAGWLTAASALARCETSNAPHLIYLPERCTAMEKIFSDIEALKEQNIIIALSEGIRDENGKYFCESSAFSHDIFGHTQLAGAARVVEKAIKDKFGCKTRSVEINVPQRCSSFCASATDIEESVKIGRRGTEAALCGKSGIMMGFLRDSDYHVKITENPISEIANIERKMPDEYISASGNDVTEKFIKYARPLILGEPKLVYEDGLPKHISL